MGNIPKYDTISGIREALINTEKFNQLIKARKEHIKPAPPVKDGEARKKIHGLSDFVVYGRYKLTSVGQVFRVSTSKPLECVPDVCTLKEFSYLPM